MEHHLFLDYYQSISFLFVALFIIRSVLLLIKLYQILKPSIPTSSVVCPSPVISIIVNEYRSAFRTNDLFFDVESYLIHKGRPSVVRVSTSNNSNTFTCTIDSDQDIEDTFDGMQLKWSLRSNKKKFKMLGLFNRWRKMRVLELSFEQMYENRVRNVYLRRVMEEGAILRGKNVGRPEREDASFGWVYRLWTSVIHLLPILVAFFS